MALKSHYASGTVKITSVEAAVCFALRAAFDILILNLGS